MINLERQLDCQINNHFKVYKQALILLGARQVGKTTMLKRLFPDAHYMLADNTSTKNILESYDISAYQQFLGNNKQIIIDEVHLLSEPGRAAKILYDLVPNIQLILTGSSSLHIKNSTGESLAGRKISYHLYPLTFSEYLIQTNILNGKEFDQKILNNILGTTKSTITIFDRQAVLNNLLVYGSYPETLQLNNDKRYLANLADSVIFKDILQLNLIDNYDKAKKLLKLLAFQIGNLVSYRELGQRLAMDQRTVQKYINIFEESYLIYRLYPFSKNKRNELTKTAKIYFWDLGLRNSLINNFTTPEIRNDLGALFENFIINEVKKIIAYEYLDYKLNYWRLNSSGEVDLIISNNHDTFIACEIKYRNGKISRAFTNRYPEAQTHVITADNFY